MIKEAIIKIVDKQDLTYEEAFTVMTEIMSGGDLRHPECRIFSGAEYEEHWCRDDR